jgi:hypothetical protein
MRLGPSPESVDIDHRDMDRFLSTSCFTLDGAMRGRLICGVHGN